MNRAVVIDIGTGYTKMGLAGNIEPQCVVPTCVASSTKKTPGVKVHNPGSGISELDFYTGDDAYQRKDSPNYLLKYPVAKGRIDNWDDIERFMQHAIYGNLRCTPEEHLFLLTEPPLNTAENRERMAEVMFETFNVKGLHMEVGAVLSLYAQSRARAERQAAAGGGISNRDLTGIVVDSGDGLTRVIPVFDGFVAAGCIQELPLGGRHVTDFVSDMLRDRGEPVPAEQRLEAARSIKEQHSYICRDVVAEYQKFDADAKKFKHFTGVFPKTKERWSITMGYERFLAPEVFFHPEIFVGPEVHVPPLPTIVDHCITQCPIDYRRRLYGNVCLSGGSTAFLHFKERLQRDLQQIVDARLKQAELISGVPPQPLRVQADDATGQRKANRYASWLGGALLGAEPTFESICKSKREYNEVGPQCMRGRQALHM